MHKSSRAAQGSNPNRRMSQPQTTGPKDRTRRVSDVSGYPRGADPLAPGPGAGGLTGYHDDKLASDKGARKARGGKEAPEAPTFDADHYNPDGSLRTVHKIPKFADAYAEASKARYIRHKSPVDREKELSVRQVFGES